MSDNDCFFEPDAPGCFCINNPDDPSCQEEPAPMKEPMDGDDEKVGFFFGWGGQLAFTMAAAWGTAWAAMDLFRYNKGDDKVAAWKVGDDIYGDFNYQKYAELILQYGALSLWGFAAIIQLIANFGVLNGFNLLTWMVILPIGFFLVNLTAGILMLIAYDKSWDANNDDIDNSTYTVHFTSVRSLVLEWMVMEASVAIGLMEFAEEWFWANFMRLPEEKREEKMGKKEEKMDHKEKYALLGSLFGF